MIEVTILGCEGTRERERRDNDLTDYIERLDFVQLFSIENYRYLLKAVEVKKTLE
jgi:hypothetical protein